MDRNRKFIFYVVGLPACIALLLASLHIARLEQARQALSWLLSTEALTPGLIIAVALIISFVHKAHVA